MMDTVHIGLIGDRDDGVTAHRAIPVALAMAADATGVSVQVQWIGTGTVGDGRALEAFDALWCVPASPYRSMDGALTAIRHAREAQVPFLGTCGGFQHAVVEYARHVLGWADAEHAETAPDAARPVIVPLSCGLVEVRDTVKLLPGSHIAAIYQADEIEEGYHCRYGLGSGFREAIAGRPLRVAAVDEQNDVRALELDGHPFFIATLFQHERAALQGVCPPLVKAFVRAASEQRIGKAA
ncbi:MAG TPA: CTP synthase [Dyella sp.]|nr:CTP synthase [Dyella sp.]